MRTLIITTISSALVALTLILPGAVSARLAGSAVQAQAVAAAVVTPAVSPAERACEAFSAYQAHPSAASLNRLVVASVRLGRGYLRADVGQLDADASSPSPKAAKYVASDRRYLLEDCARP